MENAGSSYSGTGSHQQSDRGSFMLWFGIEIWGEPGGWEMWRTVPRPQCRWGTKASPPCLIPAISGLCRRFNTNLQGWSSFGSPELSAFLGCPKLFRNMTCFSLHLPCTFSGNRFQKSGWRTPQGYEPMRPKIALSAQQRASPLYFLGCWRMLGSCTAEPSWWVSTSAWARREPSPGI